MRIVIALVLFSLPAMGAERVTVKKRDPKTGKLRTTHRCKVGKKFVTCQEEKPADEAELLMRAQPAPDYVVPEELKKPGYGAWR